MLNCYPFFCIKVNRYSYQHSETTKTLDNPETHRPAGYSAAANNARAGRPTAASFSPSLLSSSAGRHFLHCCGGRCRPSKGPAGVTCRDAS
mmetsp:Transcript_5424/g.9897  ORF Transcript_5424/g.9897 Transcript_5424/m.9897 type:complete len:91 (-) Transcript_5424:249-521(-)